jgi:hypothetical protein
MKIATVVGAAMGMVAQNLDYAAVADAASGALVHHTLQFGLQGLQTRDAAFYCLQLGARNRIDLAAGLLRAVRQAQKVADRFQREAKFTGMADEGEAILRLPLERSASGSRPICS